MKNCLMIPLFMVLLLLPVAPGAAQTTVGESVCLQCHPNLPEKYSRPVALWRSSIHAANGIACQHCHGGNPTDVANAMNPDQGFLGVPKDVEIPAFCGRCHVGVHKDYLASAHGQALGAGGPTCVTCHGSHGAVKASLELINEQLCSRCHSYERAGRIKAAMSALDGAIITLELQIARLKGEGIAVDREEKGLFAARNHFHSLFHTVDTAVVERESAQIKTDLAAVETELQQIDNGLRQRRNFGGFVVLGALFVALLAHLLRKSLD